MPIFIAAGFKGTGQKAPVVLLHVSHDKQEALGVAADAVRTGREEITAAEVFTCHRGSGKRFDPSRLLNDDVAEQEREANLARAKAEADAVREAKAKDEDAVAPVVPGQETAAPPVPVESAEPEATTETVVDEAAAEAADLPLPDASNRNTRKPR